MRFRFLYLVQLLRRYHKICLVTGLCLTINFVGHMLVCVPRTNEDLLLPRDSSHGSSYYSTIRKSAAPKQQRAFLVVAILTGPSYFDRRKAIRETWLSDTPDDVIRLFVIGTRDVSNEDKAALEYERRQYNDLLLLADFADAYTALTAKVLRTFQWLDENVDFRYVLKADDDTYARVDKLTSELRARRWHDRFYWGFFDGQARVKRSGQWAEKNWVLCDTYLPHARGGGYVLSKDLVQYIAVNAHLLKRYNNEDVSVGAWLGPLSVDRQHDVRFDTEYRSRGCSNEYIVTHKQEPRDMREKHQQLQNTGRLCANEFKVRNSYVYNWAELPSSCCVRSDPAVP